MIIELASESLKKPLQLACTKNSARKLLMHTRKWRNWQTHQT